MPLFLDTTLEMPSKASTLSVFTRSFDASVAEKLWEEACTACGCSQEDPDIIDLENIFRFFSKQPGRIGVHGMSMRIRLMASQNLAVIGAVVA